MDSRFTHHGHSLSPITAQGHTELPLPDSILEKGGYLFLLENAEGSPRKSNELISGMPPPSLIVSKTDPML